MATYKIIGRSGPSEKYTSYGIHVPREIAEALRDRFEFTFEVTDEGFLYRPVPIGSEAPSAELPVWAQGGES